MKINQTWKFYLRIIGVTLNATICIITYRIIIKKIKKKKNINKNILLKYME